MEFDLQGHRGARALFPENTLAGFRAALALGVPALELDVAVTADDVVVVSHDPMLNPDLTRGPDGRWLDPPVPPIRALTLEKLRRYDVGRLRPGSRTAAAFPDQQTADGERIPTLAEVLALGARLTIELKTFPDRPGLSVPPERMAELVLAEVDAAGAAGHVVLQSFDWRAVRAVRRRRPEITRAWLTQRQDAAAQRLWWNAPPASPPRAVAAEGGPIWSPEAGELTEALLAEAHALGLRVVPWGADDAPGIARMLALGVDGLITDRPDLALVQRG